MLKQFFNQIMHIDELKHANRERLRLETLFCKLKANHQIFENDFKLRFKMDDESVIDESGCSGQITFYLGDYVIRYELSEFKSIQLYRRGKVDNTQYSELLLISFENRIEYFSDQLFVTSDLYQLEILVNHVLKNKLRLG